MSRTYTEVKTPSGGYMCHGRVTREEAIAEARGCYEYRLKEAQKFLAMSDEEMMVTVVRGRYRQHKIEELKP